MVKHEFKKKPVPTVGIRVPNSYRKNIVGNDDNREEYQ